MADEDGALLDALARLSDTGGTFGTGVAGDSRSREDQIEIALMFLDMADRVLKRLVGNPEVVDGEVP